MSSQSTIATTQHALASAKNVNASNMTLEGPETWDKWYQTIKNICMDTKTGATSGVFRDMSVWHAIMSEARRSATQHEASQRFVQQMIMACISSENFDVIKSIPDKDPDNENNQRYNRARLQILALQEDKASKSTATLRALIDEQRNMKIDDYKKTGVKDSKAVTLFFQAHNNIVHRINSIAENNQNDADLLYSIQSNLPDRFKAPARRAQSVADLKGLLIQESQLYLDSIDTQEQVFTASDAKKSDESTNEKICWGWRSTGSCRYGDRCRFQHVGKGRPDQSQGNFTTRGGHQVHLRQTVQERRMRRRQRLPFPHGGYDQRGNAPTRPQQVGRNSQSGRFRQNQGSRFTTRRGHEVNLHEQRREEEEPRYYNDDEEDMLGPHDEDQYENGIY